MTVVLRRRISSCSVRRTRSRAANEEVASKSLYCRVTCNIRSNKDKGLPLMERLHKSQPVAEMSIAEALKLAQDLLLYLRTTFKDGRQQRPPRRAAAEQTGLFRRRRFEPTKERAARASAKSGAFTNADQSGRRSRSLRRRKHCYARRSPLDAGKGMQTGERGRGPGTRR